MKKARFVLTIIDSKGKKIHSARTHTEAEANIMYRKFYRVLVQKLKQKCEFNVKAIGA